MIIALIIIMVVMALGAVLAAQAIGNESIVVNRQSNAKAIAAANAGISDALFRLDQGVDSGTFCVKAGDSSCLQGGAAIPIQQQMPLGTTVSYIATKVNDAKWTIQSVGTVNGVQGAVQETVTRQSQYKYAIFGQAGLDFNGKSVNGFGNYSPGSAVTGNPLNCPDVAPDPPTDPPNPNPTNPVCVEIGSNGTINCPGTSHSANQDLPLSVLADYYSGGGGVSGACGTTQPFDTLYNLPDKPPPAGNYQCPGNLTTDSKGNKVAQLGTGYGQPTIGTTDPTQQPTIYVCNNTYVSIQGNLQVLGPVQFYIELDSATNQALNANPGIPTLDIATGATVNVTPPAPPTTLPDAKLLQIFTNSTGTIGRKSNGAFYYGGTIYAPNASLTDAGCQSVYYGALVINSFRCNGGPNMTIYYDKDLANLYGPWVTTGYVQIPPGSVPNF
jgi:hypothetical protein